MEDNKNGYLIENHDTKKERIVLSNNS